MGFCVAVKRLHKNMHYVRHEFIDEINFHFAVGCHPNVVQPIGFSLCPCDTFLATECMQVGGDGLGRQFFRHLRQFQMAGIFRELQALSPEFRGEISDSWKLLAVLGGLGGVDLRSLGGTVAIYRNIPGNFRQKS